MFEYDRGLIYVNMQDAALLFRTGGEATGLRLTVEDIFLEHLQRMETSPTREEAAR